MTPTLGWMLNKDAARVTSFQQPPLFSKLSHLTLMNHIVYYRPQRSWAKVMFLQASVILLTGGGCLPQCMLGHPPEQTPPVEADPPEQTPPRNRHPTQADTLLPPGADTPPPPEADSSIRSTSGRYASYWNAFLFGVLFSGNVFVSRWR